MNFLATGAIDYFNADHLRAGIGIKTRALRGASVTVVAQGAAFAIQTIGTIIMARLLTPQDFGLVAMVLTVSLLLGNVGVNGFTEAIIQTENINHRQISTLFWINVGLSTALALLFIACAAVMVWFYKEPRLQAIIIAIAASNVIAGLSVQHQALLKRNMQFHKTSANDIAAALASVGAGIFLAWYGWGYWALVAKWVISPLMITVGAWLMCSWRPGLPARGTGVRRMLKFAFHTYGNFVMSYLRRTLDKILIGRFFGTQPLGSYDRAYQLTNMLPVQIITPLYGVAVAAFSRLTDDAEKYRHAFLKVLSVLAFVAMPLSAALTLMSHDVILLLLGPQWKEAGDIFFVFGLSIGVSIIYITHGWLHLSLGTPDRWFRWSIVELAVTALCFAAALPFGTVGVAAAFSASFYILIGPALWYAGKPIGLTVSSIILTVWKPYAAATAAGFCCWSVFHVCGPLSGKLMNLHSINRITITAATCLCLYLICIAALYKSLKPIKDFTAVVQDMILRKVKSE